MIKTTTTKVIELRDWDELVSSTYGRPYSFQQQDGCKDRGKHYITIPAKDDDYENDSIPDVIECDEEWVSFTSWLARSPKQPLIGQKYDFQLAFWWDRNFYPDVQMVANDLHKKGLIDAGDYMIDIDW